MSLEVHSIAYTEHYSDNSPSLIIGYGNDFDMIDDRDSNVSMHFGSGVCASLHMNNLNLDLNINADHTFSIEHYSIGLDEIASDKISANEQQFINAIAQLLIKVMDSVTSYNYCIGSIHNGMKAIRAKLVEFEHNMSAIILATQ